MWPQLRLPVLNLPSLKPVLYYYYFFSNLSVAQINAWWFASLISSVLLLFDAERLRREVKIIFQFSFIWEKIKGRVYIYGLVQRGACWCFWISPSVNETQVQRTCSTVELFSAGRGMTLVLLWHMYIMYTLYFCVHHNNSTYIRTFTDERPNSKALILTGSWFGTSRGEVHGILLLYDLALWKRRPKIPFDLYWYLLPFCLRCFFVICTYHFIFCFIYSFLFLWLCFYYYILRWPYPSLHWQRGNKLGVSVRFFFFWSIFFLF